MDMPGFVLNPNSFDDSSAKHAERLQKQLHRHSVPPTGNLQVSDLRICPA